MKTDMRSLAVLLLPMSVLLVAGCGGDNPSTPPPTGVTTISLTGVVATGAAVPGTTVSAKCTTGSGTATSAANGSYTITLSADAKLPCALEVTLADGTKLHSVTADAGTSTTTGNDTATTVKANVTPATELIVAALAGGDSAAFFTGFDSTAAAKVTDTTLAAANTGVVNLLKATGVDLSAAGNLLNTALTPANGSTAGNSYDQALEALAKKLADNGMTLDDLKSIVGANPPPGLPKPPPSALLNKPLLPPELAMADSAANCSALRSATYRVVMPRYSDVAQETTQIMVDAKTLNVTDLGDANPATATDQWVANGECRYIGHFGSAQRMDVVVTQAGVLVARRYDSTDQKYRQAVAFPEQAHTVAELAGDWNAIGREWVSGTDALSAVYTGTSGNWTIAADGTVSNINHCLLSQCQAVTGKNISYSVNPTITPTTGGFALTNSTDGWVSRTYAYKAGGGEMMLVDVSGDGSVSFWTRKTDMAAPDQDSLTRVWNSNSDTSAVASTLSDNEFTNGAASGNSYNRVSRLDGHPETLQVNTPRSGYLYRPLATTNNAAGNPVTPNEFTGLPLRGMGLTALWLTGANGGTGGLLFSPQKPAAPTTALPAPDLLGKSYAPTCAALRSGTYRVFRLHNGSAEVFTNSLNAATLTWATTPTVPTWVASPTEACRFSNVPGTADIVVSQAGVFFNRTIDVATGAHILAIGFPEQSHTVADLQGNWNALGLERNSDPTTVGYNGITATANIDATGAVTAATWCENEATRSVAGADCQAVTTGLPTHTVNPAGGFDVSGGGQLFIYNSATGKMAMKVDADGSFQIRTPVQPLSSTEGHVQTQWNVSVNSVMDANAALTSSSFTVKSYDAATGKVIRTSNDDGHDEELLVNSPRAGYTYRAPIVDAPTTNPAGGKVQVREFTSLNLRNSVGISALWMPQLMADQVATNALGRLLISVQKP